MERSQTSKSSANVCLQIDRLRTAVYLFVGRRAIATSLTSAAVKDLAASTWSQNVMRIGEGVTPLPV